MKQSGHLNASEETGTGCPSLQSMEGHLQTSTNVWVETATTIYRSDYLTVPPLVGCCLCHIWTMTARHPTKLRYILIIYT